MGVLNMTVFKEKITPGSAVEGLIKDVQIRKVTAKAAGCTGAWIH